MQQFKSPIPPIVFPNGDGGESCPRDGTQKKIKIVKPASVCFAVAFFRMHFLPMVFDVCHRDFA